MKDIAKLAGVSYGTVSNVLNNRGNVSLEKIRLVESAAEELGYFFNEKASSLRSNKKEDIALIIPTIDDYFYRRIYTLTIKKAEELGVNLNLHITDYNPILEEAKLKTSIPTNKHILVATCMSNAFEYYNNLSLKDSFVIFLNSNFKFDNTNIFDVSFNTQQLNTDFSQYIAEKNYRKILFFSDKHFKNNWLLNVDNVDYVDCTSPFNLPTAVETLYEKSYDLIIVTSIEKYESIMSAKRILQSFDDVDIISLIDTPNNFEFKITPYLQDINLLVEQVFNIIEKNSNINSVTLPYHGFLIESKHTHIDKSINILMIESPSTTSLLKIKPYFETKLDITINIDVIKYNEYEILLDDNYLDNYDLIRIDMAYLPELASDIFKPLSPKFQKLTNRFINDLDEYMYYDNKLYALPFDISCMLLMYRSDVLTRQSIAREFYEETKLTSIIPKDYNAYNQLEKFLYNTYGDIFKPSTVCIGSSITCGNEFLIRIPSNNALNEQGELNLENKDVKKALNSYSKSVSFAKSSTNSFWDDVVKEYAEGNTILSIVYSNYIHMLKSFNKELLYKTSYTMPPSDKSLIGGGVFGLGKNTQKEDLCYLFLETLYSEQIGTLLTHLGATMPIKGIFNDINLQSIYPWLKLIPEVLSNNTRRHYDSSGKVRNTIEYEKTIGRLVKKYLTKNK